MLSIKQSYLVVSKKQLFKSAESTHLSVLSEYLAENSISCPPKELYEWYNKNPNRDFENTELCISVINSVKKMNKPRGRSLKNKE